MVLIPKTNMDTQGVGVLGSEWKVVEAVIDNWIKTVVQFHNFLHVFCTGRGLGTAIMDIKIAQELASVYQEPLFLLLFDIRKAYDNLDRGRLLQTLAGYWAGLKLRELMA